MDKPVYLILLMLILLVSAGTAGTKLSSLGISYKQKSQVVDAHFEDVDRKNLTVEGSNYRLSVFVPQPRITGLAVNGESVLSDRSPGAIEVSSGGDLYTSAESSKRARLNIWRHGPYFYEIHILDFPLTTADGKDFPGKGELVFYCYPDKFHVQAIVRPSEDTEVKSALLPLSIRDNLSGVGGGSAPRMRWETYGVSDNVPALSAVTPVPASSVLSKMLDTSASVIAMIPNGKWSKGDERSGWFAILPSNGSSMEEMTGRVVAEARPLTADRFIVGTGAAFEGYDHVRGHYVVRTMPALTSLSFESFWVTPNRYLTADIAVKNDVTNGRIYVKHYTPGLGCLEAGMVTDPHGFPLPLPIQVSKNFAGEHEEPDDTAFGETYFPLSLEREQSLNLRSLHIMQNWGNHPLKQVSSIRFFEHYYHLSTGVTETTCYVPLTKRASHDAGYTIADFRGMSGITWLGQPQHHHVALIGFLQYDDGERHNLRYLNTDFDYISPNLAKFTMNYMSDDDKIKASVDVMEIPQLDETRSFVRIRYDVLEPVEIAGDIRRNLRFVNANTDITKNRFQKVAYLDENNQVKEVDLRYDDSWILEGAPLGTEYPFIAMYASDKSNNAFVVLNYKGRIGGKPLERLGTSAVGYNNHVAEQFLTVPTTDNKLLPGDYLEADVMLMPYGFDWDDWRRPNRERTYYGSKGPTLKAIYGSREADFPSTILAGPKGYAEFRISGGHDYLPLVVKGLPYYKAPMLWEKMGQWNFIDQQVKGNDWYQIVPGEQGFDFVFLVRQRNGMNHHYMVTQATCDSEIRSITEESGEVVVRAVEAGRMEITSPRLFEGLQNRVQAHTDAIRAEGVAQEARTVPLLARASAGYADVVVKRVGEDGYDLQLDGEGIMEIRAGYLKPLGTYTIEVGGKSKTVTADKVGTLVFPLETHGKSDAKLRPVR